MTLEEIIDKSKEICKNQKEKGCSQCPIVAFTCIDLNGFLSGSATGLIKLRDYLESNENKKALSLRKINKKRQNGEVKNET